MCYIERQKMDEKQIKFQKRKKKKQTSQNW